MENSFADVVPKCMLSSLWYSEHFYCVYISLYSNILLSVYSTPIALYYTDCYHNVSAKSMYT